MPSCPRRQNASQGSLARPIAGGAFGKVAMINLPYIRERWGELFSLLEVAPQISDMHQVVVTLRRVG